MNGIDKQAETARVAMGLARQDIVAGQAVRSLLIALYIAGVLAMLAVAVDADATRSGVVWGLVPGVAAFMAALVLAHQTEIIDQSVGCVRFSINPFLMNCDAWAPHTDWFSGRMPMPALPGQKAVGVSEAEAARNRFTIFGLLIHLPSVLSVLWAVVALFGGAVPATLDLEIFAVLAVAGLVGAALVTLRIATTRLKVAKTLGEVSTPPSFVMSQRRLGA